jgi:hypothetical protein
VTKSEDEKSSLQSSFKCSGMFNVHINSSPEKRPRGRKRKEARVKKNFSGKLTANPLIGRFIPGDVTNEITEEIP